MKIPLNTLSSLNTEDERFLIAWAVSLEILNPKRAAILIARKMRAEENKSSQIVIHEVWEWNSFFFNIVNPSTKDSPQSSWKEVAAGTTVLTYSQKIKLHKFKFLIRKGNIRNNSFKEIHAYFRFHDIFHSSHVIIDNSCIWIKHQPERARHWLTN